MKEIFVFVYLPNEINGTPAGIFSYDRKEKVGKFSYGRKYKDKFNIPVSFDLPISNKEVISNQFNGLFSAFRDSQPDYWGRTVYASINKRNLQELNEDEILLVNGASRIGNLDFRETLNSPEPELSLPNFSSLDGLVKASEDIQKGLEVDKAYRQLILQGTTVGGMRPKCTIEHEHKLWIAKFPSIQDTYNTVKVECATMEIARLAGIKTPTLKIENISGKDVFFIERFDRFYDKNQQGYTRKGFISCLSFLKKHEQDRDYGYPDLSDLLRKNFDNKGASELFKRMLFNIAVRNIDDHGRNHGVIFYNNKIELSPAYDITPSISREGVSTEFDLAINVGNYGRSATINNAMSSYERFGITDTEAIKHIEDIKEALSSWKDVFRLYEVCDKDINLFSHTFEEGVKRLNNIENFNNGGFNSDVLIF